MKAELYDKPLPHGKIVPFAAPAILLLSFGAALMWSWRKWADILIDFGRELYVPWQISLGKVLYRDIAHFFGPLSQYFNALLFKIFGTSYAVIFGANIVLLALFLVGLHLFIARITNRLTAFVCCLAVITMFSFSHYTFVGNYNFVSPYAHEATHGVILSFLMIYLLWQSAVNGRERHLVGAGVVFGLVLLTKAEVAVAAALPAFFYLSLPWRPGQMKVAGKRTALFVAFALVPALLFFLYFASIMPVRDATMAMAGPWVLLANAGMTNSFFYRVVMGLVDWPDNLRTMLVGTLIVVAPLSVGIYLPRSLKPYARSFSYLGVIFIQLIFMLFGDVYVMRALPLLDFLAIALLSVAFLKTAPAERTQRLLPLLMWAIFSFALLWKIAFNASIYHYGFYLVLPSAVTILVMLTWFLPGWANKTSATSPARLPSALMVVAGLAVVSLKTSDVRYAQKTYSIGAGADRIVAYTPDIDPRGPVVAEAIAWLQNNLDDDDTFTVFPEGVMLNYLTRRANPGRYTNFMPPELSAFGEERILQDLENKPPDYVLLVHKDTSEYGVDLFGRDETYGKQIMTWIRGTYRFAAVFGAQPLQNNKFGIEVLKL